MRLAQIIGSIEAATLIVTINPNNGAHLKRAIPERTALRGKGAQAPPRGGTPFQILTTPALSDTRMKGKTMAHYATCFNCAVDKASCPRRAALQKALVGSHVTSIKFRCSERKSLFYTGQRVSFDWRIYDNDGYSYEDSSLSLVFHGTIVRERGSKFVLQVDHGKDASGEGIEASDVFTKNEELLIKVRPADMKVLDEPSKAVCLTCYHIEGNPINRCYRNGDATGWMPKGCIQTAPIAKTEVSDELVF